MKKIMYCIAVLLMFGCTTDEKEIKTAAYNYLDAMGNYRIDDARPYASTETCEKTLDGIQNYLMPKVDTNYIKSNTPATIEILGVEILSDTTAVVNYKKTTPITTQNNGRLDMIKEDGRWCAEVIINMSPMLKQDTMKCQIPDSLKNRKFMRVKDIKRSQSETTK